MNDLGKKEIFFTIGRVTLIVYGLILAAILGVGVYAARSVIFRPWLVRDWIMAVAVGHKIFAFGGRTMERPMSQIFSA